MNVKIHTWKSFYLLAGLRNYIDAVRTEHVDDASLIRFVVESLFRLLYT